MHSIVSTAISTTVDHTERIRQKVSEVFKFDPKPEQIETINHLLNGRDVMAFFRTGFGKSICFQAPALLIDKPVLVVSPLQALIHEQVKELNALGVHSIYLTNTSAKDFPMNLARLKAGHYKLAYLAPELMSVRAASEIFKPDRFGLIAVDEAHCISTWGDDFRYTYKKLGQLRQLCGYPPTLATSAIGPAEIANDIQNSLELKSPSIIRGDPERPNISFSMERFDGELSKTKALFSFLRSAQEKDEKTIVFFGSIRELEDTAAAAKAEGISSIIYHARLEPAQRIANQTSFSRGDCPIVFSSIAFGMGINIPDIIHIRRFGLPSSLDGLYQEMGRAGRDEDLSADCKVLFSARDEQTVSRRANEALPPDWRFASVYHAAREFLYRTARSRERGNFNAYQFFMIFKNYKPREAAEVRTVWTLLQRFGAIELNAGKIVFNATPEKDKNPLAAADLETYCMAIQNRAANLRDLVASRNPRELLMSYMRSQKITPSPNESQESTQLGPIASTILSKLSKADYLRSNLREDCTAEIIGKNKTSIWQNTVASSDFGFSYRELGNRDLLGEVYLSPQICISYLTQEGERWISVETGKSIKAPTKFPDLLKRFFQHSSREIVSEALSPSLSKIKGGNGLDQASDAFLNQAFQLFGKAINGTEIIAKVFGVKNPSSRQARILLEHFTHQEPKMVEEDTPTPNLDED